MIAKQMEIRSNIKEYFDRAYSGETIIVARKQSRNVVIISEEEYNRLLQAARVGAYASAMKKPLSKNENTTELLEFNKKKLSSIRDFKDNWNGNGAPAFSDSLIDKIETLIEGLDIQPEIFPTALGTIQLEYDNSRKDHMEIEIGEDDIAEIYLIRFNGEEVYDNISVSRESINERTFSFFR